MSRAAYSPTIATQVLPANGLRACPERLAADGPLSPSVQRQLLWAFLLFGLAARCLRYLLAFPLWEDECFLCVNLASRDYLGILQPLQFHQVAPPLFLWIELTVVKLLGFNELALRLFPFLCSVASLFLFRRLAGRLVRGVPLLFAVACFAVGYPGVRYAAEAKQYASDLLVSLILVTLVVDWWRRPQDRRRLWALAVLAPLAAWLSYPAVFVMGGASIFLAVVLTRSRDRKSWLAWLAFNVTLLAGFAAAFFLVARNQSQAEIEFMRRYWANNFPPLASALDLARWLVTIHAGEMLAWPVGGRNGGSSLTLLFFAGGLAVLLRQRRWMLLTLVLAPFAVHLAAAALQRYPYGGHAKFSMHLAPWICLLASIGAAAFVSRLSGRPAHAALAACLLFPALVGLGSVCRDILSPYKTESDEQARAFAIWFWPAAQFQAEAICLKTDLGLDFSPAAYSELSFSAMYLCNQRIYSPRHAAGLPPRLDLPDSKGPLRFVLYRDHHYPFDEAGLKRWLAGMQQQYRLTSRERYPFPRHRRQRLVGVNSVEIFTFVRASH